MFYSPLRYPGGKNKLSGFLAKICIDNNIHGHYIEPYAGGAAVALFLLFEGFVKKITINDKDRSIYAFWYSVLNHTEELCSLISQTKITISQHEALKKIQKDESSYSLLELGFATLFLNRTNRDGILKGGVIGGKEQNGNYKLDCRFNKAEIIRKIKLIASKKSHINLYSLDALELIDRIDYNDIPEISSIFYFDPPYFLKGASLYMNYYEKEDHQLVATKIKAIRGVNWIVSYDNHEVIKKLYEPLKAKEYSFNHSAHSSKSGKEILFFSENIVLPKERVWNPVDFKYVKKPNSKKIQFHPSEV